MFEKYDAYKDSGIDWIGKIPTDWDALKLKNVAFSNPTNTALANSLDKNTQVCFLAMENVEADGTVNYQNKRRLASVKSGFTNFIKNDVLVAKITPCFENGKGALVDQLNSEIGFGSTEFHVLRSKHNCHPKFLYYLTKSHNFMDFGEGMMIGSAGQKRVPTDFIENFNLALPNKTLQGEIAKFLDAKTSEIEQVIAIKKQQIALLNERKQIVIQKAVTRGLDPNIAMKDSEVEWIGQIPEHWTVSKIRYLGTTQNGISAGGEYFGSGYPFVSYGDVYKNRVLPLEVNGLAQSTLSDQESFSVQEGDIFFTRTSETIEEIGFTSVCFKSIDKAVFAGFLIRFRPFKKAQLLKEFSKYYFSSAMMRIYFVKEMNLVIRASLSQDLLKNLDVLLPPISEQKQMFEYLENVTGKIELAISVKQSEIEKLKEYKTTLINDAVTGKIKVA